MDRVRPPIAARRLAALSALAIIASACAKSAAPEANTVPLCERCHGGNGSAAPPRTATGLTDPSVRGVGAHRRHLALQGDDVRAALPCETCHDVPTSVDAHLDGVAPVRFLDPVAAGGASARWDPQTGRCENVYCHGAGFTKLGTAGAATRPRWTLVDGSQMTCGSCHKAPPDSHAVFPGVADCSACHPDTVKADGTIDLAGGKHIDGAVQGPTGAACTLCHGAVPPDTGAHRVHATPADPAWVSYGSVAILEDVAATGGVSYYFGCGQCHPTDPAMHMDGTIEVDVARRAAPPNPTAGDELKARNAPSAAFDAATGTCSGVYCHSSGQASPAPGPAYVDTPAWTGPAGTLGCAGCHGNPPKYPSGGAGSDTANSHLDLDVSQDPVTYQWGPCWEYGHYAGLPGATHPSKHGGGDPATWPPGSKASPITCQTCHFETVDPAKVRPGGFFYFDPDGDYDLRDDRPGPICAGRGTLPSWTHSQCSTCHGGELGSGGATRPLRHVNGKREVVFDVRRTLPAGYATGLPPLPDPDPDPTIDLRPYYVYDVSASVAAMAPAFDASVRRTEGATPGSYGPPVLTTTLESARYDPATKTCSNVACHIARQAQVDALTRPPLRWGEPYEPSAQPCNSCHPM